MVDTLHFLEMEPVARPLPEAVMPISSPTPPTSFDKTTAPPAHH